MSKCALFVNYGVKINKNNVRLLTALPKDNQVTSIEGPSDLKNVRVVLAVKQMVYNSEVYFQTRLLHVNGKVYSEPKCVLTMSSLQKWSNDFKATKKTVLCAHNMEEDRGQENISPARVTQEQVQHIVGVAHATHVHTTGHTQR